MMVKDILQDWLVSREYDGLYFNECSCEIGNLFACGCDPKYCEPGVKTDKGIGPKP